ncbi:VCBS repeat-containing protein [Streptomyces sp. P9(2023)]|uniref:FG-GAP-like repeat-containing protein n=1 Tax=Streptomyces sp. P9(2023) TaxID=3064394 RepID=UPI0028F448E4|nr:FG-GAP-like repeat-containing protein [Streptomyces sp. P9(2023)]MDT9691596.1 VCBS repeat-containing protein [Streptomyces sp. P9(2023)]
MTSTSRRALRLASALVAAGLALTALPATTAHADDEPVARVLTDTEADALERRAVEAAEPQQVTPQEAASPGRALTTDPGTTATGGVSLTAASALETYRGQAETAQLGGGQGDFLAVHSLGTVTRLTASGRTVWKRDNGSLHADWQVTNVRPWQTEPYPARITLGYHANSPFADVADRGWSQGDLTGDGVADVVFTADVGTSPYRPFTSPGSPLSTGTFVTVLDGRTGATVWSRLFADAQQVVLAGDTLLVADQPSTNLNADKAATATLQGFRFAYAEGTLTPTATWTYETGKRDGRWSSVTPLGGGRAAVSWHVRKTATAPAESHTLVLNTADGSARWRTDGGLYGREAVQDTSRGRLVALEQSDYRDGLRYEVVAYDLADGTRTVLDERVNAVGTELAVGNLRDGGGSEYAVAEATLDEYLFVNASTVRALKGSDATELWSHTVKRGEDNDKDGDSALGLEVADGTVLASYVTTEGKETAANPGGSRYGTLTALNGRDGGVRWSRKGAVASPLYAQPYRSGDDWLVRTVDNEQNIRSYRLSNGRASTLTPLQADLSTGIAVDVNGDGKKDVVAAGQSHGLWAYDGPSLAAGKPRLLWQAALPGSVSGDIAVGDTDGDGRDDDLVVAADAAAVIVDARTGSVREEIDGRGQFVRSVTVADLDGDRDDEVLVPTDAVRAYNGGGRLLWSYVPAGAGPVVFSDLAVADGRVMGSYQTPGSLDGGGVVNGMALEGRTGRLAWTADPTWTGDPDTRVYAAQLYHGVYASAAIPYADGHAVVHSWIVREGDFLTTYLEFRDIRTGKVVRTGTGGGPWTLGNWFTGDEGLVLAGTASFRTFASDGGEHEIYTLPTVHRGAFATGPGGRRLLVGGTEGATYLWDPAVLTAGAHYPNQLTRLQGFAQQNLIVADLTGDGVDEIVGLGKDNTGFDRTIELSGGRYLLSDNSMHGMVTGVLTAS